MEAHGYVTGNSKKAMCIKQEENTCIIHWLFVDHIMMMHISTAIDLRREFVSLDTKISRSLVEISHGELLE
jgi:hypothetical protein